MTSDEAKYNCWAVLFICCLAAVLLLLPRTVFSQQRDDDLLLMVASITQPRGNVTIKKMDNYYQVAIDLNQNSNRYATGQAYMRSIIRAVPEYEQLVDSYLNTIISGLQMTVSGLTARVENIKPNMNQDFIDEINGIASLFTATNSVMGDGRLHKDEYWIGALLPDVVRLTACCALGVFGSASTNGNMIGRNLEWYPGTENQMLKLHSVTIIKNGGKSICLMGSLGFLCAVSGFNTTRVFGAILDSQTGETYSSMGTRSYPYDLRYALENCATLDAAAGFMRDKPYAVNHLIFLGDATVSKVLENNLSGTNRNMRSADSVLRTNIAWGIPVAVGAVNSFLLPGNFDNHTGEVDNYPRWASMLTQTSNRVAGGTVDMAGMKAIMGYHVGPGPGPYSEGNLYVHETFFTSVQSIIFVPSIWRLDIAFAPVGSLPNDPIYQTVFSDNPFGD